MALELLMAELLLTTPIDYTVMTDQQATDSLNDLVVDGPADTQALLQYMTLEKFRTGNLFGRVKMVAETRPIRAGNVWEIPPVPLGVADADIIPTQDQIAAAAAFMRFLDTDTTATVTLLDSRIDTILNDLGPSGCEAIGAGDKTAIQALSNNKTTRGEEIGFGFVRVRDVARARLANAGG